MPELLQMLAELPEPFPMGVDGQQRQRNLEEYIEGLRLMSELNKQNKQQEQLTEDKLGRFDDRLRATRPSDSPLFVHNQTPPSPEALELLERVQTREGLGVLGRSYLAGIPAGGMDLLGMMSQIAPGPNFRDTDRGPSISGDSLRELINVDPSDPLNIIGEFGNPIGSTTKLAAMAGKFGPELLAALPAFVRRAKPLLKVDPSDLNRAEFIYGAEEAVQAPNSRRLYDAGLELQDDALRVWGGQPMQMVPENLPVLADNLTQEAMASYRQRPHMAGWYKANLDEAMTHASRIHPELATDADSQTAFKVIMAVTSNGQEVPLNARLTNDYYRLWKETGQFPIAGSGKEVKAMKQSFNTANTIIADQGFDGFVDFLSRDFTVRDLKAQGFKITGENMDTVVKGSAVFGPKIGGGFMQNLMGNYNPPTFDRWFMRTYGRHTGTLLASPKKIGSQVEEFIQALEDVEPEAFRAIGMTKTQALQHPEEASAVVLKAFSKGDFKVKSDVNNAARNLQKSLAGLVDSPGGGNQREFMRKTMTMVRDNLRAQGVQVDTADVQALLWYAEKDLYGKLGARVNTDTVDYATVWKQLAEQHLAGQ